MIAGENKYGRNPAGHALFSLFPPTPKIFEQESSLQQLDHLKNLVIMAAADNALSEQEIALLIDRCAELGLAEEDLEKAIAFALSNEAKMKFPVDRTEQNRMLSDLIRMMAADGQLSEIEKRLFALAAAKMGIEKETLDELIDKLVGGVDS